MYDLLDHPKALSIVREVQLRMQREAIARQEFRAWLRPDVKAEFINGETIMHSPALRRHNQTVRFILSLLDHYLVYNDIGEVAVEKAMVATERHDFEPDICFWLEEKAVKFEDDMLYYPPPDLVVEVLSKSTAERDYGVKKRTYQAERVAEYWIVDPKQYTVEQHVLKQNKQGREEYSLSARLGYQDQITSRVVRHFTVPVRSFFNKAARNKALKELDWLGKP